MIKEIRNNEEYFECGECKLIYKDKVWVEKCETWCRKNKSCDLEITKHAIKNND